MLGIFKGVVFVMVMIQSYDASVVLGIIKLSSRCVTK